MRHVNVLAGEDVNLVFSIDGKAPDSLQLELKSFNTKSNKDSIQTLSSPIINDKVSFNINGEVNKDNAIKEVALKAIKKKTGARGLRSILENVLLKTMFDIPSLDNVSEVIVDVSSVRGESQPIIVHSKNKQEKDKSKTSAA